MKFLSQINVNTEYTLPIVDGTNGQVLATDGNGNAYWGSISAGATNLDALTDVILTSPSSGQLLRYGIPPGSGETLPVWYNFTPNYLTPSSSIDNLGDVTITSAASGQVLQWNGTAWVNATLSTVDYVSKVQHTVKAGVAITKGQAVYVTSADGTNMIVGLASNAAESTSSKVIGLAASNAATNDQIFVVTEGLLAGLNTSTATAGDPVWLGTNGNLIFGLLNKPVAPAHLVYIGVVTRVQQNNGEIFVNVQNGFELNEIHDALIVSPTAGQLLRRDSDNLWKNWTPNYLTAEADTLATVTARGATTTSNITVNGAAFAASFSATGLLITNADTSGSLQPDQGSPANKIYSFRWAGNEQGYIDTDAKITFAGFKTPTGTASQFLKANGTVDSSVYITSAALSGYATQAWVNSNFYNQSQIDDFFGGAEPISGYNKSNWDTAYNDKVNSASFNTTNGVLTLTQQDGGTVTVDLDGRYLTSDTDAQTLTWEAPTKNLSITNGNTVTLEGLATEEFVTAQGYITGYTETDTLATVVARGSTTSNPISVIETTGGGFLFRTSSGWGGWARHGFSFANGSGTVMKSLGAYGGSGTSLTYMYLGTDYQTNTLRIYNDYVYVPGLDLAMSNSNSSHGAGTYFRGDGSHFVLGLNNGNTFYLNYGNGGGALRTYGTWYHHDVQILSTSRVLTNVSGNISMFTNDSGYITGYTETDTLATVTSRGASTSTALTFSGGSGTTPTLALDRNIATPSNYYNGLQFEVRATSGTAGIGLHRNGYSHVGIYHDSSNELKFNMNAGTPVLSANAGTIWGSGNDGSGSGLDADLLDGNHASAFYLATNPSGYITGSYLDDYTRGAYRVISDYNSNSTWYIRSNGQFVFGTGHDWTASFRLNIDNGSGYGSNGSWAYFGQQDSNATNGTWRGVRIRKFAGGGPVDGDLSAGAYYIGTTRKDTNWDAAYSWGNHADAPYWNVSLNQNIQVESQQVTFAGDVVIQGTLTESSSIRFKENITPLESSLDKVNQLEAVSYNKIGEDNREIGLIAEDVAELFPEVVTYNDEGQPQGIQYQRLSVILLKAMQEQNAVIAALTERVNKLENK